MTYTWKPSPRSLAGTAAHLNPIADFRLTLVQQKLGKDPDRWWSLLIDLNHTSIDDFDKAVRKSGVPGKLRIPLAYGPEDRRLVLENHLVAIFVTEALLPHLNAADNTFGIVALHDGMITPESSFDPHPVSPDISKIGVSKETAVMAIIDDGIAIAHNLFRDGPTSSRVDYAAVLGAAPAEGGGDCTIGRSLDKNRIDELLHQFTIDGLLDEGRFYQATGQIDFFDHHFSPVSLRRSHGTHVAALAAGHRMGTMGDERPIICACLPPRVTEDVTGQSMLPAVALALQCLKNQATRYVIQEEGKLTDKPAPVVVNFSFGNYAGPHDGTGLFARLFSQFLTDKPGEMRRAVVLPAGNGNLSRTHAQVMLDDVPDTERQTLHLVVQPDDRTATHTQMWLPFAESFPPPSFATITVTPPFCSPTQMICSTVQKNSTWHLADEKVHEVARLSYRFEAGPTQRGVVTLSLAPTSDLTGDIATAPPGRWKIEVTPTLTPDVGAPTYLPSTSAQAWIRRDETLPGFMPGGRQAYFDDPRYQKFGKYGAPMATDPKNSDSLVRREGTLSGFATGATTIIVGAATAATYKISDYSASGPVSPNPNLDIPTGMSARSGPDAVLRGDDSPLQPGVISAGSSSGSFVRLSGTSVAAPRAARALATLMTEHETFDRASFIDWVKRHDEPPLAGPTQRGGGSPLIPVAVDFWEIPDGALEVPIEEPERSASTSS